MAMKLESRKSLREARLRDLRGCFNEEGLEVGRRERDHQPPPRRVEKAISQCGCRGRSGGGGGGGVAVAEVDLLCPT